MSDKIKFVHINLIAREWKKLAQFYIDVFDCVPVYPERDLSGDWIDNLTKIPEVTIRGIHLRLPGYDNGPTLEIFEYNKLTDQNNLPRINDPGFSHIAFHVNNVKETLQKLITHEGELYGELIKKEIEGIGVLTAVYAKDPEGNIVELQNWQKTN
jgi:predicted enzyme related to lactoylglutathione lyase